MSPSGSGIRGTGQCRSGGQWDSGLNFFALVFELDFMVLVSYFLLAEQVFCCSIKKNKFCCKYETFFEITTNMKIAGNKSRTGESVLNLYLYTK